MVFGLGRAILEQNFDGQTLMGNSHTPTKESFLKTTEFPFFPRHILREPGGSPLKF